MALSKIEGNSLDVGQIGGRRNLLFNCGFKVSQRGDYTTPTVLGANNVYWVDRWSTWDQSANKTFSHNTVTKDGITKKTLKVEATSSSAGSGYMGFVQPIESQDLQVGQTYTYSIWIKSNIQCRQRMNGMVATNVNNSEGHTGGGDWEFFSWTFVFTRSDVTSSTCGVISRDSNGNNITLVDGDYIEIMEPQLEIGSVATPFEHRSYGEEIQLCRRYFAKGNWVACPVLDPNNTDRLRIPPCNVPMRVGPSISLRHPVNNTANQGYTFSSAQTVTISSISSFTYAHQIGDNVYAQSNISGRLTYFNVEMDAEL